MAWDLKLLPNRKCLIRNVRTSDHQRGTRKLIGYKSIYISDIDRRSQRIISVHRRFAKNVAVTILHGHRGKQAGLHFFTVLVLIDVDSARIRESQYWCFPFECDPKVRIRCSVRIIRITWVDEAVRERLRSCVTIVVGKGGS